MTQGIVPWEPYGSALDGQPVIGYNLNSKMCFHTLRNGSERAWFNTLATALPHRGRSIGVVIIYFTYSFHIREWYRAFLIPALILF